MEDDVKPVEETPVEEIVESTEEVEETTETPEEVAKPEEEE